MKQYTISAKNVYMMNSIALQALIYTTMNAILLQAINAKQERLQFELVKRKKARFCTKNTGNNKQNNHLNLVFWITLFLAFRADLKCTFRASWLATFLTLIL